MTDYQQSNQLNFLRCVNRYVAPLKQKIIEFTYEGTAIITEMGFFNKLK